MTGKPQDPELARRLAAEAAPDDAVRALLGPGGLPQGIEDLVADVTGGSHSQWAISGDLGRVLARAVLVHGCRNVIELGAGSSSVIVAGALAEAGGGRLTSVEEHPEWCRAQWERVAGYVGVDAELLQARPVPVLGRLGLYYRYRVDEARVRARGPYDLVLVDGPQYFYGRSGALPLLRRSLAPGALLVLDDARRAGELEAVWGWLRSYGGLQLALLDPAWGNKGMAVLRVTGEVAPRFSAGAFATGMDRGLRRLYRNRGRRQQPGETL